MSPSGEYHEAVWFTSSREGPYGDPHGQRAATAEDFNIALKGTSSTSGFACVGGRKGIYHQLFFPIQPVRHRGQPRRTWNTITSAIPRAN